MCTGGAISRGRYCLKHSIGGSCWRDRSIGCIASYITGTSTRNKRVGFGMWSSDWLRTCCSNIGSKNEILNVSRWEFLPAPFERSSGDVAMVPR